MLKVDEKQTVKKYEYVLRWTDSVERYVKYDNNKNEYVKVNIMDAQVIKTLGEAEKTADTMDKEGYGKPEIVKVICKDIA